MEYRFEPNRIVDEYFVGTIEKITDISGRLRSASILQTDRRISIKVLTNPLTEKTIGPITIDYDKLSYPPFQAGKTFLFAISNNVCIGVLPVAEPDQVSLTNNEIKNVKEFVVEALHKPFPRFSEPNRVIPGDQKAAQEIDNRWNVKN